MLARAWSWLVPDGEDRLRPRAYVVLALLTILLHIGGVSTIPPIDRDEARYATSTKQMLATGDFVDIRLGEKPRYLQPAGIYWLEAIAAAPFGGSHAPIWAFRLPSQIASLVVVLLTAWFGTRLRGPPLGLAAGLILAPSLLLSAEAHFAKIDSTLLLATLVAQIALYCTVARDPERRFKFVGWPLVFWLTIGAGAMLKGPIIVLVVGLTIIAFGLWQRDWRFLRDLHPLRGLGLALLIVAPWLVAITIKSHGLFWQIAIGKSFADKIAHGQQAHGGPPGYHTLLFMVTFFPGIVLAGLGGVYAWRHRAERIVRFLLCWILPTWVMFELVVTKLPHYVLPVFPALALLAAWGVIEAPALLNAAAARWWHRLALLLFLVAGAAVTLLPLVAARQLNEPSTAAVYAAAALAACAMLAGLMLWLKPEPARLLPLVLVTGLGYFTLLQFVVPAFGQLWVSERLARRIDALQGCSHVSVAVAGYSEPSLLFYFGPKTVLGAGNAAAQQLISHPACGLAVIDATQRAAFLEAAQSNGLDIESVGRVDGIDYANGHQLMLELFVTEDSALELQKE